MQIIKPNVNGSQVPVQAQRVPATNPPKPKGRDIADQAINLRVYLALQLRQKCLTAGLDQDQYSSASVTALCIALERSGVRGISDDTLAGCVKELVIE